jgi:uncharacterized membrane-anchored protein
MRRPNTGLRDRTKRLAPKVPEITLIFWVIKLLTTGIGETTSDAMGQRSVPVAGAVGLLGFAFALRAQLRSDRYRAPVYWTCVLMLAVFGTMVADGLKDGLGLSYAVTTPFFALVVAAVFFFWYRSEGTLSIHSIDSPRRERFYWGAVLATFALGTAAGDMTAMTLHLGFLPSAGLFAVLIAIPGVLYWRGRLGAVAAFWSAYVVTRPLGASFADWFGKPHAQTGVGLGDATVSVLGLAVFAALVGYVTLTKRDVQRTPHLRLQPAEG